MDGIKVIIAGNGFLVQPLVYDGHPVDMKQSQVFESVDAFCKWFEKKYSDVCAGDKDGPIFVRGR